MLTSVKYPSEPALQLELGRAYSAIGEDRKAERLFLEILAREPESRPAQLELARTLAYQGHYIQSDQIYRYLLSLNPADEAAAIGLTSNLLREHRPGEAAAVADAALGYHANSLRLLEFKDRIAEGLFGGEERALPSTDNTFSAAADYINGSAGNHSWRAAERLELRLAPSLTSDLHLEQDVLHGLDDPLEIAQTFSEALRWKPLERLSVSAGAGAIRFDKGAVRGLYETMLSGQAASHLVVGAGFSRVPIVPDAEAAEQQLTAQGWDAFSIWTPARWQINLSASRMQDSDGNAGARQSVDAIRQWNTAKLGYSAGCRMRHYGFNRGVSHGYFSPDNYQSYQGEFGLTFHPGQRYRAEVTAYIGAESIAAGAPFQSAWEVTFRNQLKLGRWDLGLDYFTAHMAQVTGAFRADGARFVLIHHF